MNIFESTLKNIRYPIIIWKKDVDNKYVCYYTNDKISGVNNGTYLKDYLTSKGTHVKELYDDFFIKKNSLTIRDDNTSITINYLDENTFFEFHTFTENITLLSAISHKIRSPLTNIMGIITIIDTTSLNNENKKYLNIIKESSCLITNIVNDIIDILNFQQNKMKLSNDHIHVRKMIKNCINITSQPKKKIQMIVDIKRNVPDMIIADNNKLMQIIINILSNSLKFTDHGNITVTVTVQNIEKNNDLNDTYDLLFAIKDTGCGMTIQQKNNIEIILREPTHLSNKYVVDGFGLIICKNLCDLFGGKIWFKSEIDIGSIFYFNIKCDGLKIMKPSV